MGNLCSDNAYSQIKELYPQDFQKYIQTSELEKQVSSNFTSTQTKLNQQISKVEDQRLSAITSKKNEVKDHFEKVKQQVDKSYPGGISFLEKGKNAKIQDLLGYSIAQKQYQDITQQVKKNFDQEKQTVNQKLEAAKAEQLKSLPPKPALEKFNALSEKVKSDTYAQGVAQFKTQIDQKSKQLSESFSKKVAPDGLLQKFKELVPNDKLNSLTEQIKQQITKSAANFIGNPNEGKATLF